MVSNKTRVEPVPVLVPTTFPAGRGHYRLYLLLSCLSLRAHYSFPFTPPCTLTFSFFVPPLSSLPLAVRDRSRPFETFMTETYVVRRERRAMRVDSQREMKHAFARLRLRGIRIVGMIAARTTVVAVLLQLQSPTRTRTRARSNIHGRF